MGATIHSEISGPTVTGRYARSLLFSLVIGLNTISSTAGSEPGNQVSDSTANVSWSQSTVEQADPVVLTLSDGNELGDADSGHLTPSPVPTERLAQLQELYQQSLDADRVQRIKAIESLRNVEPNELLRARVAQMARQDVDHLVRGHAQILAADWNIDWKATQQPLKFIISDSDDRPDSNGAEAEINAARALSPTPRTASSFLSKSPSLFSPQPPYWLATDVAQTGLPSDVARESSGQITDQQLPAAQEPRILNRPFDAPADDFVLTTPIDLEEIFAHPFEAPLGFTGRSGVARTEFQQDAHFVPIEDRWRLGFTEWDRYDRGHPPVDDYPYQEGWWLDPYNQNVLKGDYPIIGQHTFLNITATSLMLHQYRQVPTPTTPFESTVNPFSEPFFGDPNQYFYTHFFRVAFDLFHGNEAFKPFDWRILVEPVFNVNHLSVGELGVVNPDVRRGLQRTRADFALEQWFVEAKLADLSPDYDFLSARVGSQFFVSDFRGFLFKDINRGVRLFGTRFANRDQFNLIWFDQTEKDTNSQLNTFRDRHQNTVIANYFRQDFIVPGYTAQVSFHYNHDGPSFLFDDNDFLVRPDPAGVFREHEVNAYYLGLASDGHIDRVNITSQIYLALGTDSQNPIANEEQEIFAQMAALELSYDRDWIRFRTSYFFASGDDNPDDQIARGFDTILDDPIFAGGEFSYWQRQAIRLFGVNLVQEKSLVPSLRSSKIQGQSNFVNPGLHLINLGMDFEVTPKTRVIFNTNYLWFDTTKVLETFTFQNAIGHDIGVDISVGIENRPLLNDNVIFVFGSAILIPSRGLRGLYGSEIPQALANLAAANGIQIDNEVPDFQSHFAEVILTY